MKNRLLVTLFVDGSEVNYLEMLDLGLIAQVQGGYVLTDYGKSFLTTKRNLLGRSHRTNNTNARRGNLSYQSASADSKLRCGHE